MIGFSAAMIEHHILKITKELNLQPRQVAATAVLLEEGGTVPFIARYRKEATGALDDTQLRNLDERLCYLRELEERRKAILESRLRRIEEYADDPATRSAAERLRRKVTGRGEAPAARGAGAR